MVYETWISIGKKIKMWGNTQKVCLVYYLCLERNLMLEFYEKKGYQSAGTNNYDFSTVR